MTEHTQPRRPRFSIVAAVYNVSQYLDEFFASLEGQSYGIKSLDIVLVNDGSTDDSGERCDAFAAKHPASVRVLHKENGGQGSARNLGLEHARGEWVIFVDPDDFLDERYFDAITFFVKKKASSDLSMLSTPFIFYFEKDGRTTTTHPLHFKYAPGNRVVDVSVEPENIQLGSNTAFFRMELINRIGLRFDERVRPTFEDAHFVARYMIAADTTRVGLIRSARYYYRKRADKSSAVDTAYSQPGKYTDVPRYGYLGALENAKQQLGHVPMWLQYTVLYDLVWTFRADTAITSATGSLPAALQSEFHGLVAETLTHISPEAINSFSIIGMPDDIRFAFSQGYSNEEKSPTAVRISEFDVARGLALIRYRFAGALPLEEVYVDSTLTQPLHHKVRSIEFFGRTVVRERILWVPIGKQIRIFLNGVATPFGTEISRSNYRVGEVEGKRQHRADVHKRPERFRNPRQRLLPRAQALLARELSVPALRTKGIALLLHSRVVQRAFKNAWVFMDRDTDAGDSAEALYRYISDTRPNVNAWFVINRDAADWKRLRADGVRTVAYGSLKWTLLMLSAAHLASSHADAYVLHPLDTQRFGAPRWRFTFLQHGVIKDDLSRWLNPKSIDLFVTASPAEYASIVADDTPYAFSTKEVVLSGLPRHDSLIAKRNAVPLAERTFLLVMPTWRHNLVGTPLKSSNQRTRNNDFASTAYVHHYSTLLSSERLHSIARENEYEIVFMPHPMMGPYLDEFTVPDGVRVLGYDDMDVQQVLARAALLITDYSSMAFNTAMLGVPTVYFQFDRADFYSGSHPSRAGYFDYETHGFGPVCDTVEQVEDATSTLLAEASAVHAVYAERMKNAFAFHDTRNSERVFLAMSKLNRLEAGKKNSAPRKMDAPAAGHAVAGAHVSS